MTYKLDNINVENLSELHHKVSIGARFVVFNYRIGLGLISLSRISPAILITKSQEITKYQKKYNTLNLIFGPWFLFKGPWLTYNAYKVNKNGGIDVTNDIMINISENSLKDKEVLIEKIHDIFIKLKKSDSENIKNVLKKLDKNILSIEKAYSAIFINVEEHEEPYFVIGLKLNKNFKLDTGYLKKSLNKHYYNFVKFEIFELEDNSEFSISLIEQGELIYVN